VSRPQPLPLQPLPFDALPKGSWQGRRKVRFSDCDPAGIVYFARYFDMMNGAVEDWFGEALGLDYHAIIGARRIGLGYVRAEAEFVRPSRMGEELTFSILVERLGRASIGLRVRAYKAEAPALEARLVIVTTSLDVHRAIAVPDDIRAPVAQYLEQHPCP
jgi:4-hydroxybenzoyl-CoA thioesterase